MQGGLLAAPLTYGQDETPAELVSSLSQLLRPDCSRRQQKGSAPCWFTGCKRQICIT
ncbi:hypothetical protein BOO71_0001810 [Deinococcus marmoris]|uniref:Uncharacterized protein n=1 Tax=Deinococcus marmoris TaxID=249408 RepID=A0A1U7P3Q7_9DEIO|nr:hypothetical protein BOO71_0001810 [Deinococcus marmoris]